PAIASRGVLSGELDGRDLRVRQGERPAALLVEELDERDRYRAVAIEHVAHHLGAVGLDDGGIAPVVEGELDHLVKRKIPPNLWHPPLECHAPTGRLER